jgi:hypothetical protein
MSFDAGSTHTAHRRPAKQSNIQQRDSPLRIPSTFGNVIRILSSSCGIPTVLFYSSFPNRENKIVFFRETPICARKHFPVWDSATWIYVLKKTRAWPSPLYPRPNTMRKSVVSMKVYSLTTFRAGSRTHTASSRHRIDWAVSLLIIRTQVLLEEGKWRGMVAAVLPRFCSHANRSPGNESE